MTAPLIPATGGAVVLRWDAHLGEDEAGAFVCIGCGRRFDVIPPFLWLAEDGREAERAAAGRAERTARNFMPGEGAFAPTRLDRRLRLGLPLTLTPWIAPRSPDPPPHRAGGRI